MARRSSRIASAPAQPTQSPHPPPTSKIAASKPAPKAKVKVQKSTAPKPNPTKTEPAIVPFASEAALDTFLAENGSSTPQGVWAKLAKKQSGIPSVTYDQLIDTALCHGWIDGQRRSHCDTYFLQRVTPRRKGSMWSQRNVTKITQLMDKGRMREAGLKEVQLAKEDGRWDNAYAGSKDMAIPKVLDERLDDKGREKLKGMASMERYSIFMGLQTAKKEETKAKRLEAAVTLLMGN